MVASPGTGAIMKGRDDNSAWADQSEAERLGARVDSKRERHIVATGPSRPHAAWLVLLLGLVLGGGMAAAGFYLYAKQPAPPPAQTPPAISTDAAPEKPAATLENEPVAEAPQPALATPSASATPPVSAPPAPAPAVTPATAAPKVAPQPCILGRTGVLAKVAIEVEHYWVEPEPPGEVACAAVRAWFTNNSGACGRSLRTPSLAPTRPTSPIGFNCSSSEERCAGPESRRIER